MLNDILAGDDFSQRSNMASIAKIYPVSKVHGASMGPTWGRQAPGGHHVGPMNLAIWAVNVFLPVSVSQ